MNVVEEESCWEYDDRESIENPGLVHHNTESLLKQKNFGYTLMKEYDISLTQKGGFRLTLL